MLKITPEELKVFAKYIYDLTGIVLDDAKAYLLETRLSKLVGETGSKSFFELYNKVKADGTKTFQRLIVDAITTNETSFFRDGFPFDLLQYKILPDIIDVKRKMLPGLVPRVRIWSAACSTGQEVFSLAMVLDELLRGYTTCSVTILGTDISDAAIAQASYGRYSKFEVERGMTPVRLQQHFTPMPEGMWRVKDELRSHVTFKTHNLMGLLAGLGKFDIVLCRNVAIYFSMDDRVKLFNKIGGVLERGGSLLLGATESLTGMDTVFETKRYLRSIFYQLKA